MNLLPTLTKENFFNELYAKYPLGVQVFYDWIDKYKLRTECASIFYAHKDNQANPKYHDLPGAMQIGIWIEFMMERGGCAWEIEDLASYNWKRDMAEMLYLIQHEQEMDNY